MQSLKVFNFFILISTLLLFLALNYNVTLLQTSAIGIALGFTAVALAMNVNGRFYPLEKMRDKDRQFLSRKKIITKPQPK